MTAVLQNQLRIFTFLILCCCFTIPSNAQCTENATTSDGHQIIFNGVTYNNDNGECTSTWSYCLIAGPGNPEISHFSIANAVCLDCMSSAEDIIASSHPVEVGTDPTTGYCGIKYDFGLSPNEEVCFSFTLNGAFDIGERVFVSKAGNGYTTIPVCGPVCTNVTCETTPDPDCTTVLSSRPVENTYDNCGNWCNDYVLTLGSGNCYTAGDDLTFTEYTNGTALLSGSVVQDGEVGQLSVLFTGKTTDTPENSPKYMLCIDDGGDFWYYYTAFTGTFTFPNGEVINMTRKGPAFQIGYGANVQDNELGGAAWFYYNNGTKSGDMNFQLGDPTDCTEEGITLEVECAKVGSIFETLHDDNASNGDYVTVESGNNSLNQVPSGAQNRIRFNVNVSKGNLYNIFARVKAPSGSDDSFWVRANNGTWVKWNQIQQSSSFIWDQVHDNNNDNAPVAFFLNTGSNKIDFAYREDGVLLDKIYISLSEETPTGLGVDAENCDCYNNVNIVCEAINTNCDGSNTNGINLDISGNAQSFSILWSNGDTTQNLSDLAPGTYSVTVTGENGCTDTCEAIIEDIEPFSISCNATSASCNANGSNNSNGTVTITATGGTGPYIYHWSNNACTDYEDNLEAGEYTITVTDGNGCELVCSVEVEVELPIYLSCNVLNDYCNGNENAGIYLDMSANPAWFSYEWSNGATTSALSNVGPGTYSVTVTYDETGCSATCEATIEPLEPLSILCEATPTGCDEANNGTVTVTATGGTAPYTYHWSNTTCTDYDDELEAGIYTITVTDANNCSEVCSVEVLSGEPIEITCQANNGSCEGNQSASITTSVSGDPENYSFLWSNGATSQNIENIGPGDYFVTVIAPNGCTATCSASIEDLGLLSIACEANNTSCASNQDGTVSVSATGGQAPYTYLWNNNNTDDTQNNLPAGTYSVTVTDANGCEATCSVDVASSQPVIITCNAQDNPCEGNQGSFITTTVAGGTGIYTFEWSNGATSQNIDNIGPGNYTVTVTDENGCQAVCENTINQIDLLAVACQASNTSCATNQDGTVSVTTTGGQAPYSYLWNNNNTDDTQNNLPAGTYSVTVTDANGCEATCSVDVASSEPVIITCNAQDNPCESNQGSFITTTVAGGTGIYTFEWSNGATSQNIDNIGPGNYTVTVTDENGCQAVCENTINQIDLLAVTCQASNTSCASNQDGTVSVTATGGQAPYSYLWNNSNTDDTQNNLPAGTYAVTVTDANGCEANCSVDVASSEPLTITCNAQDNPCEGNLGSFITTTVAGGTGIYTFEWSNGATSQNIDNIGPGNYTVTVTDENGCQAVCENTINQIDLLSIACEASNTSCATNQDGTVSVTATGGQAPYSYLWNNNNTDDTQNNLPAGTYAVTVTDANGCEAICSVDVASSEPLTITCNAQDNPCEGNQGSFITTTVAGGTGIYTFEWSNGATSQNIDNIGPGNYTLTVTDENGCQAICENTINQIDLLSIACEASNTSCATNQDGTVSVTATGGQAPYSYLWNNSNTDDTQNNLPAGTYSVTVTDANGCEATCSVDVASSEPLIITCNAQDNLCEGNLGSFITTTVAGGTGIYTFEWSNGATSQNIDNIGPGNYTVTVTDENGCQAVCENTINQIDLLAIACEATTTSCGSVNDGTVSATATGGLAPYTYLWSNGQETNTQGDLGAGTYTVTVTDANGCQAICSSTVNSNASMTLSCETSEAICGQVSGNAINVNITGGSGSYTFLWSNGATSQNLENLSAGTYSLTVTDANGCDASCQTSITPYTPLNAACSLQDFICGSPNTGNIEVTANGGDGNYSYLWSNGSTSAITNSVEAGTYEVTVTDGSGCTAICSVEIPDTAPVSVSCTAQSGGCDQPNSGSITANVSGGTGIYTFLWSNGATSQNIENVPSGNYSLTVTDENGCASVCETVIENIEAIIASCEATDLACGAANTGSINVIVSGGTAPYNFLWSNGATSQSQDNLDGGNYQVTITDANGCIAICEAAVETPAPIIVISSATELACFGDETASADLQIDGGVEPYTYLWDNGSTEATLENLGAGFYGVTVTDANGCTGICGPWVISPDPIIASFDNTHISCFGGNDGSIVTTITGGTGDYTLEWSNGASTKDIYNLETGVYTITVSDENGCTNIFTTTIESNEVLLASCTSTPLSCHDNNSGSILLSVSGGTGDYSFEWSNGETTQSLSGINSGTYSVTVTDGNGCQTTCSSVVDAPTLLTVSCNSNDLVCAEASTGSINITVEGGTPPFAYQWSNGATTQNISELNIGTFTVTVTDANDCYAICSASVESTIAVTANCIGQNLFCGEVNTGSVDVSVIGGTAPFTYLWNNGATTQNLSNLNAGTYEVTITDANGCNTICSTSITAFDALTASCQGQDLVCGLANSGNIQLSLSGGTAPFTYSWSNGATSQNLIDINEGNYAVTVTDANGCIAVCEASLTYITPMTAICTAQDLVCAAAGTGSIDLNVTGGTAPYTFLWNNGQMVEDLTNLDDGEYTVMVTDANGCTVICSSEVSTLPALEVVCNPDGVTCGNSNSGNINTEVTGGEAPYTYLWNNGATTESLFNIPTGAYSVTVTDANGCIASCTTAVEVSLGLNLDCAATGTQCGEDGTGSVDLTITGGTGNYTFVWSNGATTEDLADLDAGTYSVTVSDSNGCSGVCSSTVEESTQLEAVCTTEEIPCGGQPDGSIDVTVTGGSGDYTYEWSNGATTEDIGGVTAGTYTVTVSDSNGCTTECSNTITEAPAFSISCIKTNISCKNANDGSIDVSTAGGVAPFVFEWSNGAITEDLDNLSQGTYSLTVTDSNGCSTTCSSFISEPASLLVIASGNNISCNGANDGTAFATVIGGTVPYTYAWSNGATTPFINAMTAGSYTLTVTDGNGCMNFGAVVISEPELLVATCNPVNENCQPASGAIDLNITGGTAPFSYNWSNGATTEDLLNIVAGDYSVTVTDAKGCSTICTSVVESGNPIALTAVSTAATCGTPSLGGIDLTITGGSGPYSYQWSNGVNTEDNTNLDGGIYTVTVTDVFGCFSTYTDTIEHAPTLTIELNSQQIDCNGSASGSISATVGQGMPPFSYTWSNGATTDFIENLTVGTYTLTVTDANGCQGYATTDISQPSALFAVTSSNPISCNGDNNGSAYATTIGGSAPYQYAWNNGGTTSFINGLVAGTYEVTITDNNGCTVTSSTTIEAPMAIGITFTSNQLSCQDDNTGSIATAISGGEAPFSYSWSTGATTSSLENLSAGVYAVSVIDNNGCTEVAFMTIEALNPLIANCIAQDVVCAGEANGSVDLTVTGGVEPYTYEWSNGSTDTSIHDLIAGQYSVTVTDANGCTSVCIKTVNQPEQLIALYGSTNVTCNGDTDGTLFAEAQGGTAPYTFEWSTGDDTETVENLPAGAYGLTLTDANGCIFICGIFINEPEVITCSSQSDPALLGLFDVLVSADGGTAPFQYSIDNGVTYQSSGIFTGVEAGTYEVVVMDANGCISECGAINLGGSPGLDSGDLGRTALSPVPAVNNLDISYETTIEGFTIFEVKSLQGRVLFRTDMNTTVGENTFSINTSRLSNGTYFLAIYTERGVQTKQFTIAR